MAVSDAQKRANEAYRRKSAKQTTLRFYPAEAELWEHLCEQENKAGYLKDLIRKDMEEQDQRSK